MSSALGYRDQSQHPYPEIKIAAVARYKCHRHVRMQSKGLAVSSAADLHLAMGLARTDGSSHPLACLDSRSGTGLVPSRCDFATLQKDRFLNFLWTRRTNAMMPERMA